MDRLRTLLRFPRIIWVAVGLAAFLYLPSLAIGFRGDDCEQVSNLDGQGPHPDRWFDLWRFFDGTQADAQSYVHRGFAPFWKVLDVQGRKMDFVRPLSSVSLTLDHLLFGHQAAGYRLQTVLWFLVFVAVAGLVLRRVLSGPLGGLALLVFAVDKVHLQWAAQSCGRHYSITTIAVLLGLLAHIRFREDGWRPGRVLSVLGLFVGLLAGEAALQAAAYLAAYELAGAPGSLAQRARGLAPEAVLSVAYVGAYAALGFGAHGSYYVDPARHPGDALLHFVEGLPRLLLEELFSVSLYVGSHPVLLGGAVAATVLLGVLFQWSLRDLPEAEARAARWLSLGGVLALVPGMGSQMHEPELIVPSFGIAVAMASVIAAGLRAARGGAATPWVRVGLCAGAVWLGVVHLVIEPVQLPLLSLERVQDAHYRRYLDGVRDKQLAEIMGREALPAGKRVDVAVLGAPSALIYPTIVSLPEANSPRWWLLSVGEGDPVTIRRTDAATLELTFQAGLTAERPLAAGTEVAMAPMTVRVLDVEGGRIKRYEVRFPEPIESSPLVFAVFQGGALHKLEIPPVAKTVSL